MFLFIPIGSFISSFSLTKRPLYGRCKLKQFTHSHYSAAWFHHKGEVFAFLRIVSTAEKTFSGVASCPIRGSSTWLAYRPLHYLCFLLEIILAFGSTLSPSQRMRPEETQMRQLWDIRLTRCHSLQTNSRRESQSYPPVSRPSSHMMSWISFIWQHPISGKNERREDSEHVHQETMKEELTSHFRKGKKEYLPRLS